MYNKYTFINNNIRKKVLEEKKKQEKSQTTFDMLQNVDNYVLVDIETTGLSPVNDEIIEIGAIKVKDCKIVDQYNELIKINRKLSPFITNLTGITGEMLNKGKLPTIALKEFIDFVDEDVIIGHNVNFDLGFLKNKCKKYIDYSLNNRYIDTMYLAKKIGSKQYKL